MFVGREAIVNLKGVSFRYKNDTTFALKNLDLEIDRGDTLFLMGPTGSGKSTLCLTLNGLIPHMIKGELKGEINIRGLDTQSHKVKEFAPLLGLVFQDFENQLFSTNVESEIAFGPENMGLSWSDIDDKVRYAIRLTKLNGFEKRDPFSLSGGERQRLAIASVISLRAEILCFDEAFTDLDPLTKGEFLLQYDSGSTLDRFF